MRLATVIQLALVFQLAALNLIAVGSDGTPSPEPPYWQQLLVDAAASAAGRNDLGERLRKCLGDKGIGLKPRLDCARALGRLQYQPAIPDLVGCVELVDPTAQAEFTIPGVCPCVRALQMLGTATVPSVVRAYLDEHVRRPEDLQKGRAGILEIVLHTRDTEEVATTFARGVAAESSDPAVRRAIHILVEALKVH